MYPLLMGGPKSWCCSAWMGWWPSTTLATARAQHTRRSVSPPAAWVCCCDEATHLALVASNRTAFEELLTENCPPAARRRLMYQGTGRPCTLDGTQAQLSMRA